MPALLSFLDPGLPDDFLGRRHIGDRLKADGFEIVNTGDERSAAGAQVTVSVRYDLHGDGPTVEALVIDVPRLDPGERFGPLNRAFALPEAEGAGFGQAQVIYTLASDPATGPALDPALAPVTDELQITPFTRGDDEVSILVVEGQAPWNALGGDDDVSAQRAVVAQADPGVTLLGGGGDDTLVGCAGEDVIAGQKGRDALYGDLGDDILDGGGGRDRLAGDQGDDIVMGGRGRDLVNGGAGDDVVQGGAGRDRIDGDTGEDQLSGGAGRDSFRFYKTDYAGDVITDYAIGEKLIFESSFDRRADILIFDRGEDLLIQHVDDPMGEAALVLTGIDLADFDIDALVLLR